MAKLIEFIRYSFWGIVSTGFNLLVFALFIYLHIPYLIANVTSYTLAVILSYELNNRFVFKGNGSSGQTKKLKYFVMRGLSVAADSFLLFLVHEVAGIDVMISKVLVSAFIILSTYLVNKFWVFR